MLAPSAPKLSGFCYDQQQPAVPPAAAGKRHRGERATDAAAAGTVRFPSSPSSSSSSLDHHTGRTSSTSGSTAKSSTYYAQAFDALAREATHARAARAARKRAVGWQVVGWLEGGVVEGWLGFCTVRYLVALILLEPSVLRTLNLTFFITSLLAFLLLPLFFFLLPTPASTQKRRSFVLPPTLSAAKRPDSTRPLNALSAAHRSATSTSRRIFAYLALTASLLLALLTAACQLAIYLAWRSSPPPFGFAGRCGWDMDACWGRGGTACSGWQWGGWVGVLCARLAGTAVLFALLILAHILTVRSAETANAASAASITTSPRVHPAAASISDSTEHKHHHSATTTVRSVRSSVPAATAAAAAAFVPPSHAPRSPPDGSSLSLQHHHQRHASLGMDDVEEEGLSPAAAAAAANELAAHKALERARALSSLTDRHRQDQEQPIGIIGWTPNPSRRSASVVPRYLRSTLPYSGEQQQQQTPDSLPAAGRPMVLDTEINPRWTAIGLGLSAPSPTGPSHPIQLPPGTYAPSVTYSGSVTSSSSHADGLGPSSSASAASPVKERGERRRWSATDVIKRKAVPTFLTLDLENPDQLRAGGTESVEEREGTPRRPASASATYALGGPSSSPLTPPTKRMSRPKSLSPPSWSIVSSSDSSSEHVDYALEEAADVVSTSPPVGRFGTSRKAYASTPPSTLVDNRLSTLWSGSEGSRLSDRRPSDYSVL